MDGDIIKGRFSSFKELIQAIRRAHENDSKTDRVKAFIFAVSISIVAVKLAKTLQAAIANKASLSQAYLIGLTLCACFLVAFWILVLMRIAKKIGWPSWVPVPYVLIVLCSLAWFGVQRMNPGNQFMALFGLQIPFVVAYFMRRL